MDMLEQFILAFVSGGIICVFAQLLIDLTKILKNNSHTFFPLKW